jgi:hypothetical protein
LWLLDERCSEKREFFLGFCHLEEINLTFVLLTNQGEYMTIHITPEAKFSYVSFESNIPQSSYMDVIARVLETFRPGKFIVTSFANKVF